MDQSKSNYNLTFLSGFALSALNVGAQVVVLSWLAVGVFHLSALQVGWIQTGLLLPNIALLLVAGVVADRYDPAKVMLWAHAFLCALHFGAATILPSIELVFSSLLIYAVCMGCGNVLVQTAKERLAARHPNKALHKRISLVSAVQFSAQGVGMSMAIAGDYIGPSGVLYIMGLCCLTSVGFFSLQLKKSGAKDNEASAVLESISKVFPHCMQVPAIKRTLLVVGFNGLLHLGFFMVLQPILVREVLGNAAWGFSVLQILFLVGMITAHIVILRKQQIEKPEQATHFCLLYSGCLALALSFPVTEAGLFILIFCWGAVAGVSANLSRLAVLSQVQDDMRGRVMSVYQLTLFGLAPLGSLFAGYVVKEAGVYQAFSLLGWGSVALFFVMMLFFSPKSHEKEAPPK